MQVVARGVDRGGVLLPLLVLQAHVGASVLIRQRRGPGVSPGVGDDHAVAKVWWDNNASRDFQHLNRDYVEEHAQWEAFLPKFQWQGKTVLDYGIGAGYLGERLFKQDAIGAYYGLDISQKSLDSAAQILHPWHQNVHLLLTPQSFASIHPDIFVSQQVIQHFPSVQYFADFLSNVDTSGAQDLMLQYRVSEKGNTTASDAYRTDSNKAFALLTDSSFIAQRLPHYEHKWTERRPMCCGTTAEYTGWSLKGR